MISVIIPTYNHALELDKCLGSLRRQIFQDFEIIVVDDGSIDRPDEVIKKYSNVKFLQQENMGAPAARNRGFKNSHGEYVIFLDADIVMYPDMLAKMHQTLIDNPEVSFVYSAFKIGNKTMRYIPFNEQTLKKYNYIHTSSLMRADDFPGFDESLKKFQDWDLWLTMIRMGKKGIGVDDVLFKIINPGKGTMSQWLPQIMYKIPWPILGFTPQVIKKYHAAQEIVRQKHRI